MKIILVPTDFSDHAMYALKVAAQIASKLQGMIRLVHVYNLPSTGFEKNHYYDEYYRLVHSNADHKMEEMLKLDFMRGIPVEKHIVNNMLMWQIPDEKQFRNSDLIVMGSHGESGFNRIIIGSNTEKMVRMANQPVLTIKNEIPDFNIKKMVFASNFFEESYSVFDKIQFFADTYDAHLFLLKIITPREFESTPVSNEYINQFVRNFNLRDYSVHVYNHKSIEAGIIEFGESVDADLIAIETHGRTGLSHLINGSLAEDVVKHEATPVLSVKIPKISEKTSKFMGFSNEYESWGSEFL
ncbi:MAG: universal stress protein [Bacteroidales bacterium]|nr:universal stress protein [Bacteroidales bacterium]MCF8386748.1 universal stress protein [Bacteroidales bacterium]MCF8398983.1 universal stress protein [Bacteroidales bacterium]